MCTVMGDMDMRCVGAWGKGRERWRKFVDSIAILAVGGGFPVLRFSFLLRALSFPRECYFPIVGCVGCSFLTR